MIEIILDAVNNFMFSLGFSNFFFPLNPKVKNLAEKTRKCLVWLFRFSFLSQYCKLRSEIMQLKISSFRCVKQAEEIHFFSVALISFF